MILDIVTFLTLSLITLTLKSCSVQLSLAQSFAYRNACSAYSYTCIYELAVIKNQQLFFLDYKPDYIFKFSYF